MPDTSSESLSSKEYRGVILKDKDPRQMGRYKVHIYGKMDHLPTDRGIWCKNHTHNSRITKSSSGTYGQYFPLQPGTEVIVRFTANDFNTGCIDRIMSDGSEKSQYNLGNFLDEDKEKSPDPSVDRDDTYLLIKTPKKNNAIYITEETEDHPANEIWISYNTKRTAIRINEDSIYISTKDNQNIKVNLDQKVEIVKSSSKKVGENRVLNVEQNYDIRVNGNTTISSEGDMKFSAKGKLHLYSATEIAINSDGVLYIYPPATLAKVATFVQGAEAEGVENL